MQNSKKLLTSNNQPQSQPQPQPTITSSTTKNQAPKNNLPQKVKLSKLLTVTIPHTKQ
jgi:hypothetical protein